MAEFDEKIIYAIVSIAISAGIFAGVHIYFKNFFSGLKGVQKLTGLVSIGIVVGELIYLGTSFDLFSIAVETIVAVGGAFWLLLIALQNHLKNLAAGLSNYLNPEINVGDLVEIKEAKGVIVDLGLTKTTVMTEDGIRVLIPNLKFSEELVKIYHRKEYCEHFKNIKETISPKTQGCEECEKEGNEWQSLRMCLTCGHVGCDRSSPGKHAQGHFKKTRHPVIVEFPNKRWRWCYVHDSYY